MISAILNTVKTELRNIDIPYEYMRWTGTVQYPYYVGSYMQIATGTEDGYQEYTLMITGTTRSTWSELESDRAKIEDIFPSIGGFQKVTDTGSIVIYYDNAFPVDTGEADLKRIQINLSIKAWKGTQ